jgi:hypothetical protein
MSARVTDAILGVWRPATSPSFRSISTRPPDGIESEFFRVVPWTFKSLAINAGDRCAGGAGGELARGRWSARAAFEDPVSPVEHAT